MNSDPRRRLRRRERLRKRQQYGPWVGACGLLAVLWLAIASSIFAPWWGVLLYVLVLLVLAAPLPRLARTDPARCLWLPAYAVLGWLVITIAGTVFGGWSP